MPGQLTVTGATLAASVVAGVTPPSVAAARYVALLTADPTQVSAEGGGYAMTIGDLTEDTTSGYARQPVTFALSPAAYSSSTTYTTGQQVSYDGYVYACAVSSVSGTAPTGSAASNSTWTYTGENYPVTYANTEALTFGPYTAAQALPVAWAALVDVASGTTGNLLYLWDLPESQQVPASQSIVVPAGYCTLTES